MKKILSTVEFLDGADLASNLLDILKLVPTDDAVVDIMDENGACFTVAKLEEQTLTDGSKVYNIILSE